MKKIGKLITTMFMTVALLALVACEPSGFETYDPSTGWLSGVSSARMYYPSNISELDNVGATTLSSGMGGTKEGMYWLAEPLAEAGMIVLAISATDNQTVLGYENAHQGGLDILESENSGSSPISGKIGNYGIIGYSKGGGAVINTASELGDAVTTCVALAPWEPSPTSNHSAATMILTGTVDAIAPAYMGQGAYDDLPAGVPKLYASMSGEGHMYWNDLSNTGSETEFITAWLQYYLEGDEASYDVFANGAGSGMTDYQFDDGIPDDGGDGGCN
ncbi:MAG: hypothetical protein K9J85_04695 [Desulfobacteraceae bacterium]|nr:hypothetical protein [Desulfobacteraceae bacterium]